MNKKLIGPIVAGLVILAAAGFGVSKIISFLKPSDSNQQKNKVAEQVNVIPVSERPYVQISPQADGRNIILIVKDLKKAAETVEYELEYQSGTLLQGAFGFIDLASVPAQEQVLLGSCSAGGKCSYHEDVQGGKLLLRFLQGDDKYVLRSDWRYIENTDDEAQVSSKDAKFQLESEELENQSYIVVYNSPGYPEGVEGEVVSEAYSLATSSTLSGEGSLSIRTTAEGEDLSLTIMGWNGSEWVEFEAEVADKTATADVELMELYIVVQK